MNLKKIITELKRRNVFKVATAYAITGWLIIQVVVSIKQPLSLPNWFDTATILLVFIGFPIALIIAWAFELTPDGLKKTDEVEIEISETKNTGKKLNSIIISVLLVLIAFLVFDRFVKDDTSLENTNPSIAVLPFKDLSPNNDQQYFSDGLSVELVNVFTKETKLKVIDPSSSFKFREKDNDLKKVGSALDVVHVLVGSVRKSGNQIRITTRLVHVRDGINVWTETYDRVYNANNIFAIQDEISQKVLEVLKVKLVINDENINKSIQITNNIEAYENYLKANQLLVNRNPKEIEEAIKLYKKVISLDKNFAEAYAKLAESYWHLINYGNINKDEALEKMRENTDKALLLNSNLAIAYAALGHYYKEKDIRIHPENIDENFKNSIEKAKSLAPNDAQILMWYANSLRIGDPKKIQNYLKALNIDPLNPVLLDNISVEYFLTEKFEKAKDFAVKNVTINPNFIKARVRLITLLSSPPNSKLGDAFIEAYKTYLKYPENLEILGFLNQISYELKLKEFAYKIEEEATKLYSENPRIFGLKTSGILSRKEYKDGIAFVDLINKMFGFKKGMVGRLRNDMAKVIYFNAENDFIIEDVKKYYPKFISDTVTNFGRDSDMLPNLIVEFRKADIKKEITKRLTNIYKKEVESKLKHNGDITKENIETLKILGNLGALNNDADLFSKILYEIYFIRKDKNTNNLEFDIDPLYDNIRNSKEVLETLKLIDEDKEAMRFKAVKYLQSIGEWKE